MLVPVHVVAGFLGTGKTTTVLGLVRARAGERIAVVVNDFGEAAIDRTLVDEGGVRIAEIQGACVCCTAPHDFTNAIGRLLDEVRPDRIVVEPTGLARPTDLVDTLRRGPHRDRIELRPTVVLVDPHVLGEPLVAEQAEAADVLVANRVDLATEAELAAFDAWAAGLWPAPLRIVRTTFGQLPADVLDWPEGAGPRAPHAHEHDHPSTEGFAARSVIWAPDVLFSPIRLREALSRARVVRAKGLFRTEEGAWLLERAGGRIHERPSAHRRDSRVDLIGDPSAVDATAAALEGAVLRPDERATGDRVEVVRPDGTRRSYDRAALAALPAGIADVSALVPKRQGAAARVAALFDAVGVAAGAEVVVVASDGLATAPVPVEALRDAVLVHSLGDGPLPAEQGGPYRLLIPGDAGPGGPCANVKGVARIVVREAQRRLSAPRTGGR